MVHRAVVPPDLSDVLEGEVYPDAGGRHQEEEHLPPGRGRPYASLCDEGSALGGERVNRVRDRARCLVRLDLHRRRVHRIRGVVESDPSGRRPGIIQGPIARAPVVEVGEHDPIARGGRENPRAIEYVRGVRVGIGSEMLLADRTPRVDDVSPVVDGLQR